ncbi:MAG: antitoxin family protein [Nitrospirae bacterium]|nr:antitoxin family protein [Nitrospirota bacterium]
MHKTIDAIYENGVIKPLERVILSESQRIRVTIDANENVVASTRAIIRADPEIIRQVAEDDEYLYVS